MFFNTGNKKGICVGDAKRVRVILARLQVSISPDDMRLPGLNLHKLKGNIDGYYAVSVSGNWRIIFKFYGKDVIDVDYIDYH